MTDIGRGGADVTAAARWSSVRRGWPSVAVLLLVLGLALSSLAAVALEQRPSASPGLQLVPADELDRRLGTYLSQREWGTPREALGADGWGLSWRGAIDTDYRYSDDGIGGITDEANEFRVGWAFWDGAQPHVSERFYGVTNPQGEAGEGIVDDRRFLENTPTHSYSRLIYSYPAEEPRFDIQIESAKVDSETLVLAATATNVDARERTINIVLKAWMAPQSRVEPVEDGLYLRGSDTDLLVVSDTPTSWQVSAAKDALDVNLRAGGLVGGEGDQGGHIGALAFNRLLRPDENSSVRVVVVEVDSGTADSQGALNRAMDTARVELLRSRSTLVARRMEARTMFGDAVTEYQDLYRQALMQLIWNESYYRWDGTSGVAPDWSGRVDARDVLIVPDKWEFPFLVSWDSAFHAATATLIDPELAADQLRFILSERWQQPDGHIPCAEWVMGQECPPVFAWAAWRVFQAGGDQEFLEDVYPALQRQYDYWWQHLHVGDSLFSGGFLGMDNLPRANGAAQADASAWMAFFARDMVRIASELRDVSASERYWIDRGQIQESINARLWDETTGFYYDLDRDGGFLRHKSYSGLIPLIAGVVPPARIPQMLNQLRDEDEFMSAGGIRSMSAASPLYAPAMAGSGINSNWRGPVWLPINYLLVRALIDIDPGLAGELRDRLVRTVADDWQATGRFHEFYDGDTGEGLGADGQGWTTLVANLIIEGWPSE